MDAAVLIFLLFYIAIIVLMIASMWKIFEKAGEPGWAALVPIYNSYIMTTSVAGKEPLWFWLLFVPFVNIVIAIMEMFAIAERFGKSAAFGMGLLFLPFIFFPMLAFGDAVHESQRRSRRRSGGRGYSDYEDDEDDRPKKKRRREEDYEDEEDERPRGKRRHEDNEDDEDRPQKRRRRDDDDY